MNSGRKRLSIPLSINRTALVNWVSIPGTSRPRSSSASPKRQNGTAIIFPLIPCSVEQFDLSDYQVILSSSHAAAKGVLIRAGQLHICYCHTPIRYAWDLYHRYLHDNSLDKGWKSIIARLVLHYIHAWDASTTPRIDYFIANSHYTARRSARL